MLNLLDIERDLNNLQRAQSVLDRIVAEASTHGAFLVDDSGFLIAEAGEIELDRVALAALVSATFGATAEIARLLGEADFKRLAHQGVNRHLFIGRAGASHILIIVFGSETNLGLVKLYAEQATSELGAILDTQPEKIELSEPTGEAEGTSEEAGEDMLPAWMDD